MQFYTVTTLLALAAFTAAQIPDPSSLPPCVLNCTQTSATSTDCGSIANVTCLCSSTSFQQAAGTCLAGCTAAEQKTALTYQTQVCAAFGGGNATTPGSASNSAPNTASNTGAGGSPSSAGSGSTPTPTGAATALTANVGAAVIAVAALAFAL